MAMEEMDNGIDQVSENAMAIIMSAGDARVCCNDALTAIEQGDIETANAKLEEADAKIAEAHHVQTDAIQGAIGGDKQEYNLLFAHAQDTLMTVYSEIHMAKKMVGIFANIENRLKALEK